MQVRIRVALLAAIVVAVVPLPLEASCSNARLFSSGYLYTPGLGTDGGAGTAASISDRVRGSFWIIGDGDPVLGVGVDNGSWAPLQSSLSTGMLYGTDAGWVSFYAGYPAIIEAGVGGSWANISAVLQSDGCPDGAVPAGELCMAMLLTDDVAGVGYFLLATAAASPSQNYRFSDGAAMTLAPIPSPLIVGAQFPPQPNTVALSLVVPEPVDGFYVDPACNDAVSAYRILARLVDASSPPPLTRSIEDWPVDLSGPVAPGEVVDVVIDCPPDKDAYLATAIELDSGFVTGNVSANSTRVECENIFTEIEPRPRIRPGDELDLRGIRGGKRERER